MRQLELFEGLEPIQKYLHVWTDAQRERIKKDPARLAVHRAGSEPAEAGEGSVDKKEPPK